MRLYTVYYISLNFSTCFGWLLHPSLGALITVITASGTGQTFPATFRCGGEVGTSNFSTIAEDSRDGLISARCCNYSYMCSWWWVELPPETCRAVYRNIIICIQSHLVGQLLTFITNVSNENTASIFRLKCVWWRADELCKLIVTYLLTYSMEQSPSWEAN
jgi:hypothetical protein